MYVSFWVRCYSGPWQFLMSCQKGHKRPCRVRIHRIGSVLPWKFVQIVYAICNFAKPCAPCHVDDFGYSTCSYGGYEKMIPVLQFVNVYLRHCFQLVT